MPCIICGLGTWKSTEILYTLWFLHTAFVIADFETIEVQKCYATICQTSLHAYKQRGCSKAMAWNTFKQSWFNHLFQACHDMWKTASGDVIVAPKKKRNWNLSWVLHDLLMSYRDLSGLQGQGVAGAIQQSGTSHLFSSTMRSLRTGAVNSCPKS